MEDDRPVRHKEDGGDDPPPATVEGRDPNGEQNGKGQEEKVEWPDTEGAAQIKVANRYCARRSSLDQKKPGDEKRAQEEEETYAEVAELSQALRNLPGRG